MTLGQIKDDRVAPALRTRLESSPYLESQLAAARSLGALGYSDGFDLAMKSLEWNQPQANLPDDPPEQAEAAPVEEIPPPVFPEDSLPAGPPEEAPPPPADPPAQPGQSLSALWSRAIGAMEQQGHKVTASLMRGARPVELTETQLKVTLPPDATMQLKQLSNSTNSKRVSRYFSQMLGREISLSAQLQQVDARQQRFIDQSTQDLRALAGTVRVLDDQQQEEY